ncbi:actin depolymerizing factor [Schizosaccharomyces japonicus yFS275]|uniref:Cofilin n=1 Tax=Schizosaccharomyces japonicus (strain yFS275 / FY16936) TaxID=402676 RepID=B6K344_SCHJY|nr:actin depolymerizing factor [Schizosaccharomyces japonicus yFS275]EEB07901.1 actin depolymerizing factor [Schizosaccharomyces japonicus yFS275]
MSLSGVKVAPECLEAFQELKLGKSVRYVVFKMNDTKTEIVVEKKNTDKDYDTFLGELPEKDCRYAIYDFEYNLGEGVRNKICFITWAPDVAPIKSKMVYASSKDTIRRALTGVGSDIQATDFSEVSYESVLEKVTRK